MFRVLHNSRSIHCLLRELTNEDLNITYSVGLHHYKYC
jgi:hypothetical protein